MANESSPAIRNKSHNEMINDLSRFCVQHLGIPMVGNMKFVYRSGTGAQRLFMRSRINDANFFGGTDGMANAHNSCTADQNDVVFITQESQQLSATLTWSKNAVHMVGLGGLRPQAFNYPRCGASADFTPVITQSQSWGSWVNMRLGHGRGAAGNLVGVSLTGHYNSWKNIHLYSPGNVTEGDVGATMMSLSLAGGNNYFEDCCLGVDTIQRSAANSLVNINTSGVCNVFKNCRFVMFQDAATPNFIYVSSGSGVQNRWTLFENCTFIAYSTSWGTSLTAAIAYQYSGDGHRLLFNNCVFHGCTDLIADGYENNCQFLSCTSTAGTGVGLAHVPQT